MSYHTSEEYKPFANLEAKNVLQERVEVPALVRLLHVPRGQRILEVGCGRGVALPALARVCEPTRLVGLDIDIDLLALARQRLDARGVDAELVLGDVRAMPFADAEFDVVVDFGTAYHVNGSERALAETERVLRPGGMFVCESRLAQRLAHPVRGGHGLPWSAVALDQARRAGLWSASVRRS
jgi:ubiquinone/menaquinone biosynthesis C-methylase UbiE